MFSDRFPSDEALKCYPLVRVLMFCLHVDGFFVSMLKNEWDFSVLMEGNLWNKCFIFFVLFEKSRFHGAFIIVCS